MKKKKSSGRDGFNSKRHGNRHVEHMKSGSFKKPVLFKDPLQDCDILRVDTEPGDRSIELGQAALINITCLGSVPTAVCLNVTTCNETIPANETCQPIVFVDTLQHQVKLFLNGTGWTDVHFYIYNDISRKTHIRSFYSYNPDSINVPALVFPTVFGICGILLIFIGSVYIMKLRKKTHVEVADFDFHPTLTSSTQSEPSIGFSRFTNSLKYAFSKTRVRVYRPPPRQAEDIPTPESSLNSDTTAQVNPYYNSL